MFSIVMATFNGSKYIEKQLESLVSQTTKPVELIISDDCSTDDTMEIIERMRSKMPFLVRVQRNASRLGYGDNFMGACELASQPYVCFCDQDDIWLPQKLSFYADLIAAMPRVSLFIHQGEVVDENLQPTGSNQPKIDADRFQPPLTGNLLSRPAGLAMCFSRELLTRHDWRNRPADFHFANSRSKHDAWIWTLANAEGGIYLTSRVLVYHRRHSGNASFYRPGTNLKRRIGQIASLIGNPSVADLENEARAYREHESYFGDLATRQDLPRDVSDRYAAMAQQYRRGHQLVTYRLSYCRSIPVKKVGLLVEGMRAGMYHNGARINRRALFQDLATVWRPPAAASVDR